MTKALKIYKASAGSGKTFTLAKEYIKLVVKNPLAYRQILAVTFTNKATEEMKMRILSQLYGIWRCLPSSAAYMEAICKELDVSETFVSRQAGIALSYLLHNYSYFRIDTIDSFFQSVLRNLARELDLTANLRVGLNDSQVEEMAVDELIENLSNEDQILRWILDYIMETINDDHSWNIINQVKDFGRTIFKDEYKAVSKQLYQKISEPHFFERYTQTLYDIRRKSKERLATIAERFFKELTDAGFSIEDLSYGKSGVAGIFIKLRDGKMDSSIEGKRVTDCLDNPSKWYKNSHPDIESLQTLVVSKLNPLLQEALNERPRQWRLYKSADLTLRHLNQLRLLESIERKVRELNENSNRFLLSDTQQMLHDLIDHSDSPFIFEKIGTQLEHIMIDEFQDTSTVQWKNFKVLLEEAMSHEGSENLIVGDVKQSIYRWRSGDWRLLGNIEQEFSNPKEQLEIKPLEFNYRSSRRVVEFNNAFFQVAARLEGISAYEDVVQKVPEGRPDEGFVSIKLLPSDDYQERMLEALANQVTLLLEKGIKPEEMAILVRTNKLIPLIANYFMEKLPEVSIVSDEAFRLDASPAIQVIIAALRLLTKPDDLIAKAFLAKAASDKPLYHGTLDAKLPKEIREGRHDLLRLPLYELTERLCLLFHLNEMEGQTAYLCAFYDQVASFVNEQLSDISSFLKEWEETLCAKTIQSADIKGIRLISIHKSKGLEFPYVFIPFCDWKMELGTTLWCKPTEPPFNELPLVPIDYSKGGMMGTIYEQDYLEESEQNKVDNMNLLYVAFTRAAKGLYVWGKEGSKGTRSEILENVGCNMDNIESATSTEEGVSVLPTLPKTEKEEEKTKEENVFLQEAEGIPLKIASLGQKVTFKQSNRSKEFANSEDEQQQTNYIQLGSILHNVFSTIRTRDDIDSALQRMELEGILYDKTITREKIENLIRKRLESPQVADWYNPRWQLFNECTILCRHPETGHVQERRPDRVMTDGERMIVVDFKFGRKKEEYNEQVREYMSLLQRMGRQDVRGYLWYVYSNEIEEVQ